MCTDEYGRADSAQFYMENDVLLAPGAPMAQGREAIADAWKGFLEMKGFHLEFAPTKIEVASSDDLAYEIGSYSLRYQDEDDEQVRDNGKYVVVWKKADGNGRQPRISSTQTSEG